MRNTVKSNNSGIRNLRKSAPRNISTKKKLDWESTNKGNSHHQQQQQHSRKQNTQARSTSKGKINN